MLNPRFVVRNVLRYGRLIMMESGMTKEELLELLKRPEGADVEFKAARNDVPHDAYKTVCAFANTDGGWVIFGVSDDGKITGVDASRVSGMRSDFLSTLNGGQKLSAHIEADPHDVEIDGKHVLAFYIHEAPRHEKPIHLGRSLDESYYRRGEGDERMGDHQLRRFVRDSDTVPWDGKACHDVDPETGIDSDTLNQYISDFYKHNPDEEEIKDSAEFLLKKNFAIREGNEVILRRAAIMLFGTEQYVQNLIFRPLLDYRRIDARHDDNVPTDRRWKDRLVSDKNILITWREVKTRYLSIAWRPFRLDPETMRRIDNIPEFTAFRESTINLLMHQDYGEHHAHPTIKWYTDQIQFENPGDALTDFNAGSSVSRNTNIVRAFRSIGLSEQAGSGIRTIREEWEKLGYSPPQIKNDKAEKRFTVTLPKADTPQAPRKSPPSTPPVPPQYPPSLKEIVQALHKSKKEMPRNDLQQALEIKDKKHFLREYLQPALESDLIEMTIPDKPNSSKQKYRLTELGREAAEKLK